jgi:hypothetical protein
LNVFGEIVSGKNFEYDDLYVYYCLDLPESKFMSLFFLMRNIPLILSDWYAEPSMIFSGYTHTASATKSSKHVRRMNQTNNEL